LVENRVVVVGALAPPFPAANHAHFNVGTGDVEEIDIFLDADISDHADFAPKRVEGIDGRDFMTHGRECGNRFYTCIFFDLQVDCSRRQCQRTAQRMLSTQN